MEDQDDLMVRKSECDELGSEVNAKAALEDVGYNNADLYIAIQEDTRKIRSLSVKFVQCQCKKSQDD